MSEGDDPPTTAEPSRRSGQSYPAHRFRRDVEDIAIVSRGAAINVRRSKTDQAGVGKRIGIPRSKKATCPVASIEAWLIDSKITWPAIQAAAMMPNAAAAGQ
jgi:hypothetical protein